MAETTLNEIKKQLLENKKSQVAGDKTLIGAVDDVGDSIEKMVKLFTRSLLDKEEERREGKKQVSRASGSGSSSSSTSSRGLFPGLNLGGLLRPLTAGIVAFGAAMVGLRGWELKAIKSMKNLLEKSIPISIQNGITKIRNSVFRIFGLTPQGVLSRDALGRFTKTPTITSQIRMRMNALRLRTLRVFGIGADGKLITTPAWQKFLSQQNLIGRVAIQVRSLFSPIVKGSEKLGGVFKGKLWQNILGLFRGGTGAAGGFLKVVGTILKPLGFFFSAWKGVSAFLGSKDEDGVIKAMGEGIGTFIGNFFGAPLDLLKKGVRWVIAKAFGVTLKEGEEYDPKTASLPEKIVKFLDVLSFENIIKSLVKLPFSFLSGAIDWVGKFFDDPIGTLQESWKTAGAGISSVGQYLKDWVTDVWAWIKSFIPDIRSVAANFSNKLMDMLPDWAKSAIAKMQSETVVPSFDSEFNTSADPNKRVIRDKNGRLVTFNEFGDARVLTNQESTDAQYQILLGIAAANEQAAAAVQKAAETMSNFGNAGASGPPGTGIAPIGETTDKTNVEFISDMQGYFNMGAKYRTGD